MDILPYELESTVEENDSKGPPKVPESIEIPEIGRSKWLKFSLKSIFGIPACPLTNGSEWIERGFALGNDVMTFKTVRSEARSAHLHPNWAYADESSYNPEENKIVGSLKRFVNKAVTMVNSFGVQSKAPDGPDGWIIDFEKAKSYAKEGQLLILSVMPTVVEGEDILQDIDRLAELINQTSASVVEINLACPNSDHNLIYLDVEQSVAICKRLREKVHESKMIIPKVGYYKDPNDLKDFVIKTIGIIDGITSTNTMSVEVIDANDNTKYLFGTNRKSAGVSGKFIWPFSLAQFEYLVKLRKELGIEKIFGLIFNGGITTPEDIQMIQQMDENILVQAAVGSRENPLLAIEYKNMVTSNLPGLEVG